MEIRQPNIQTPVYSFTRTRLLSLRTNTSLLSLSTVDRLKNLNIGYHLPRRHRSSQSIKRLKQNLHPFIVGSFNVQSVNGNDMDCKRCEISTIWLACIVNSIKSINQSLFSIQTNSNNNIHTFINMNTERAENEVILLI